MVLKKQTVWLLTMLSLIVVLSVYYVTTPTQSPTAANNAKQSQKATSSTKSNSKGVTSSITSADDQFASYKLERNQATATEAQKYEQVIASDSSTAQQVSEAKDQLDALNSQAKQEQLLEDEIISKGFGTDAVVTTDGDYAQVYVKSKNLSSKQASQIMSMVVNSSLGVKFADVKYQSTQS